MPYFTSYLQKGRRTWMLLEGKMVPGTDLEVTAQPIDLYYLNFA